MSTAVEFLWRAAGCPEPVDADGHLIRKRNMQGARCAATGLPAEYRLDDAVSDSFTTMKNAGRAWPFGGFALSAAAVWCARTLALRCSMFFARESGIWFEAMRPLPGVTHRRRMDALATILNPPEPPFVAGLPLYGIDHGGEANIERFEGALQYALICRLTGRTPDEVYADIGHGWSPPSIPITVHKGLHMASSGVPSPLAIESKRMRRKRARTDVLGINGKLQTAGGWAKSLNIPQPTLETPYIDFYVTGERLKLIELLRDVPAVGRDHSRGLGTIDGFEVSDSTIDPVCHEGRLMRPIPVEWPNDYQPNPDSYMIRECSCVAPYWHRATRTACMVPRLDQASRVVELH